MFLPWNLLNGVEEAVSPQKERILLLLGPPGSGKGTQAARLAEHYRIPHISTGDLFRENIRQQTEVGRRAKEYIDKGMLVPDSVVIEMTRDRIAKPDAKNGYLLDGFPRTIEQARAFESLLSKNAKMVVLHLAVADETIVRRIAGRLLCRKCPNIHHRESKPPQKEGVCDACGGELYQRSDDTPETVRERLRVYHEQTAPLIVFYREKGNLYTVNGENDPDTVFADLACLLHPL